MKKLICMVLVVAMALSMGITSAFAEEEQSSATLAVEDATGYAGELVSVKVDLTANSGVYGMLLPISCTGPISLESYSSGALTGWTVAKNAVWYNDKEANNDTTGTIITLNFRVDEDAAVGDTATVIVGTDAQALDKDLNNVTINAASATVTIGTQTAITDADLQAVSLTGSLVLDGIIQIKYTATGSVALDDPRISLLVWKLDDYPGSAGTTMDNPPSYTLKFTQNGTDENGNAIYQTTGQGIPAKEMGDKIRVKLCADNGGSYAYGNLMQYNPQTYCAASYGSSDPQALQDLCVSIMDYGAAAQTYFGYRTDSMMNKDFH